MIAATGFNMVVTALCFIILLLLYMVLLIPHIPAEAAFGAFPVLFILAVIFSFLVYRRFLKQYLKE
jgi:uncharacterized membrane protein